MLPTFNNPLQQIDPKTRTGVAPAVARQASFAVFRKAVISASQKTKTHYYHQLNVLMKRSLHVTIANCVVGIFGLTLALIEEGECFLTCQYIGDGSECVQTFVQHPSCTQGRSDTFKSFVLISTVVLVIGLFFRFHTEARIFSIALHLESLQPLDTGRAFWRAQLHRRLGIQLLAVLVHCPPGVYGPVNMASRGVGANTETATYRVESLFALFMCVRLFLVYQVYADYVWRKFRVALPTFGMVQSKFIVVKSAMHYHPLFFCSCALLTMIFAAALIITLAEAPLNPAISSDYSVACWFVIVSLSTTGYGDIVPKTHFGRIITIFTMVAGAILTATLISGISSALSFRHAEWQVLSKVRQHRAQHQISTAAAVALQSWWRSLKQAPNSTHNSLSTDIARLRQTKVRWDPAFVLKESPLGIVMQDIRHRQNAQARDIQKLTKRIEQHGHVTSNDSISHNLSDESSATVSRSFSPHNDPRSIDAVIESLKCITRDLERFRAGGQQATVQQTTPSTPSQESQYVQSSTFPKVSMPAPLNLTTSMPSKDKGEMGGSVYNITPVANGNELRTEISSRVRQMTDNLFPVPTSSVASLPAVHGPIVTPSTTVVSSTPDRSVFYGDDVAVLPQDMGHLSSSAWA